MDGEHKSTPRKPRKLWRKAFLEALAKTGNVREAAELADVDRSRVHRLRESSPAFAAAWDRAVEDAADVLEREAVRRAVEGVDEPVIYKGELCGTWVDGQGRVVAKDTPGAVLVPLTVKRYSDALLQTLLRAAKPEKYRERQDHTSGGRPFYKAYGFDPEPNAEG